MDRWKVSVAGIILAMISPMAVSQQPAAAQPPVVICKSDTPTPKRDWVDFATLFVGGLVAGITIAGVIAAWRGLPELKRQAKAAEDAAIAARESAEATLRQSELAMNSERAWIVEEINFPKELPFQPEDAGSSLMTMFAAFRITNYGKTVARVRDVRLNFHCMSNKTTLAPEPDYGFTNRLPELGNDGFLLVPGQKIALQVRLSSGCLTKQEADEVRLGNLRLLTYGLIVYETLGTSHKTQFCYIWYEPTGLVTDIDPRGFLRGGPPGYNVIT